MNRVLVIGSSGAGKSTFSRRLAEITGLPLIHLDRLFWKPGWVETDRAEWSEVVAQALEGERWIIDGNYSGTMKMRLAVCDTVIFLDLSRFLCTYRVLNECLTTKRPRGLIWPTGATSGWTFNSPSLYGITRIGHARRSSNV